MGLFRYKNTLPLFHRPAVPSVLRVVMRPRQRACAGLEDLGMAWSRSGKLLRILLDSFPEVGGGVRQIESLGAKRLFQKFGWQPINRKLSSQFNFHTIVNTDERFYLNKCKAFGESLPWRRHVHRHLPSAAPPSPAFLSTSPRRPCS